VISILADEYGMNRNVIYHRLRAGWTINEAVSYPRFARPERFRAETRKKINAANKKRAANHPEAVAASIKRLNKRS